MKGRDRFGSAAIRGGRGVACPVPGRSLQASRALRADVLSGRQPAAVATRWWRPGQQAAATTLER
jgi:hypothetical protein